MTNKRWMVLWLLFAAAAALTWWLRESASAPGWVQAWGSIGAIAATGIATTWPYRKTLEDQRHREEARVRERYRTIGRLFAESQPVFERVSEIERGMARDYDSNEIPEASILNFLQYRSAAISGLKHELFAVETYLATLQRFDVAELSDAEASAVLIGGMFGLQLLAEHMRRMLTVERAGDSGAAFLFGGIDDAAKAVDMARRLFDERARK